MTITTIAQSKGVEPASVRRAIKRKALGEYTNDELLPPEVAEQLMSKKPGKSKDQNKPEPDQRPNPQPPASYEPEKKKTFVDYLILLPVPLLGLVASYEVYFFASQILPWYVAIFQGAAFELIYIGLSLMKVKNSKQAKAVRNVSRAAVAISAIYCTISAGLHLNPQLFEGLNIWQRWGIAIIHGAPLAILSHNYLGVLKFKKND